MFQTSITLFKFGVFRMMTTKNLICKECKKQILDNDVEYDIVCKEIHPETHHICAWGL